MKSRWTQQGARQAVDRWGEDYGAAFALRLYSARLLGEDADLVLHGGGNVSLKGLHRTVFGDEVAALFVKASGRDLATLDPGDLPAIDLAYAQRLCELDSLTDEAMVNEIRSHRFDSSAPTPSIEALVHAVIPHDYVDHSHADAVLAVTNHANGDELAQEAMGDRVAVLPYVRPGFDLAKAVADCIRTTSDIDGIVLLHHGLITFGEDAQTAYENHVELVDACEQLIAKHFTGFRRTTVPRGVRREGEVDNRAEKVAPLLRGLLAVPTGNEDRPHSPSIMEWRTSEELLALISTRDAPRLMPDGPLTGDHIIRTKAKALYVEEPDWSHSDKLSEQLRSCIEKFRKEYTAYVETYGAYPPNLDPSPRVVILPGAGLFCWGTSKRDAIVTADIAEHTLVTKTKSDAIAPYECFPESHWYDMEFRKQQVAKVGVASSRPLERQIVIISGGAGAIGAAAAEVCVQAGAHVVIADLDTKRVAQVADEINKRFGAGSALAVVMDVTDEKSVRDGYAEAVRMYGGVDVVVPNAGVAHVSSIEEMDVADFRRVMDINATGYLLFMREGIRVLKRQGIGGNVVISASKNVFAPGAQFGAYSASKAAGHQLGKVAAIELAPDGIRVNMINADAVFGEGKRRSGLWAEVGPSRAKSRNMEEDELPDYYRGRNLLKARVCGYHVGNAVVFFASNATPTTGATLPVDGGLVDAFPR